MFRIWVADFDSPSYFVAIAAVELGYFAREGIEAEIVSSTRDVEDRFRNGDIAFQAGSAFNASSAFPDWQGAKILCALAQYAYWFMGVRRELAIERGDLQALKGLTISASTSFPGMGLRHMLDEAGLDLTRDAIRIVPSPAPIGEQGWRGRSGVDAIAQGADAFWGNGMRLAIAEHMKVAKLHIDLRRGDGPAGARYYNFPALATSDRLIAERPEVAAGAIRAIVNTQRDLRKDPALAASVGNKLFPAEEAALIEELIARDAPFYSAAISKEAVDGLVKVSMRQGLVTRPLSYGDIVATSFNELRQQP